MCMVQPGSATVNSKSNSAVPACTRAARCCPGTGFSTRTGTSSTPSAAVAVTGSLLSPSPAITTATGSPV